MWHGQCCSRRQTGSDIPGPAHNHGGHELRQKPDTPVLMAGTSPTRRLELLIWLTKSASTRLGLISVSPSISMAPLATPKPKLRRYVRRSFVVNWTSEPRRRRTNPPQVLVLAAASQRAPRILRNTRRPGTSRLRSACHYRDSGTRTSKAEGVITRPGFLVATCRVTSPSRRVIRDTAPHAPHAPPSCATVRRDGCGRLPSAPLIQCGQLAHATRRCHGRLR